MKEIVEYSNQLISIVLNVTLLVIIIKSLIIDDNGKEN